MRFVLPSQQPWHCILLYIFRPKLILFLKNPLGWIFDKDIFFTKRIFQFNLVFKLFKNTVFEKNNLTPRNRAKFLATGVWTEWKCPFECAILWRQIFDWEKIGARILCLLFLWADYKKSEHWLKASEKAKTKTRTTATRLQETPEKR